MANFGLLLSMGLGQLFPAGDYNPAILDDLKNLATKQADKENELWRFYNFFPVLCNLIMLLNFCCFIKGESIMFALQNEDDESAMILIDKIYHKDEDRQAILKQLKNQCHKKEDQALPYFESLFNTKYIRGSFVLLVYAGIFPWAGVIMIQSFSNRIVTILNSEVESDKKIQANLATQILGISSFFITFFSIYTVGKFKRKVLTIVGQIGFIVCLSLASFFSHSKNGVLTVVFMLTNFYVIQLTSVFWIYLPEVLNDNQLGFVSTFFYLNGTLTTILQEYLVAWLGVDGLFLLFACVQFLGLFFLICFMKETQGLADYQKKELYFPDKFKSALVEQGQGSQIHQIQVNLESTVQFETDVELNRDGSRRIIDEDNHKELEAEENYLELEMQSDRSLKFERVPIMPVLDINETMNEDAI